MDNPQPTPTPAPTPTHLLLLQDRWTLTSALAMLVLLQKEGCLWKLVQQSVKEILTSARTINVWLQLEESPRISVKQCVGLNWSDFTNLACQCFGSAGGLIFWDSGSQLS